MIYGNHNKRKGDIVVVARWSMADMKDIKERRPDVDPGTVRFIVTQIMFENRLITLVSDNIKPRLSHVVKLDDTNLIRVGRITDNRG